MSHFWNFSKKMLAGFVVFGILGFIFPLFWVFSIFALIAIAFFPVFWFGFHNNKYFAKRMFGKGVKK